MLWRQALDHAQMISHFCHMNIRHNWFPFATQNGINYTNTPMCHWASWAFRSQRIFSLNTVSGQRELATWDVRHCSSSVVNKCETSLLQEMGNQEERRKHVEPWMNHTWATHVSSWVKCVAFTNELEEEVLLFYFNVISIYPEVYRLCSSFISFFLSFFFYFWFFSRQGFSV